MGRILEQVARRPSLIYHAMGRGTTYLGWFVVLVHVSVSLWFLYLMLTGWGLSTTSPATSVSESTDVSWLTLSLKDGLTRGFCVAALSVPVAGILLGTLVINGYIHQMRLAVLVFSVLPLLLNFSLRTLLWKAFLLNRNIDGVSISWQYFSFRPETVLALALVSHYFALSLLLLYPKFADISTERINFIKTQSGSIGPIVKLEVLPIVGQRARALAALTLVLVMIDPAATSLIAAGRASNVTLYVTERFRLNDYASAAIGSIAGAIVMLTLVLVMTLPFSGQVQRDNPK